MKTFARLALAGGLVLGLGATGFAQAPEPAPAAPAAPAAPMKKKAPMSPKAKECSAKADAQGLHGKARKEFREKCKKGET